MSRALVHSGEFTWHTHCPFNLIAKLTLSSAVSTSTRLLPPREREKKEVGKEKEKDEKENERVIMEENRHKVPRSLPSLPHHRHKCLVAFLVIFLILDECGMHQLKNASPL